MILWRNTPHCFQKKMDAIFQPNICIDFENITGCVIFKTNNLSKLDAGRIIHKLVLEYGILAFPVDERGKYGSAVPAMICDRRLLATNSKLIADFGLNLSLHEMELNRVLHLFSIALNHFVSIQMAHKGWLELSDGLFLQNANYLTNEPKRQVKGLKIEINSILEKHSTFKVYVQVSRQGTYRTAPCQLHNLFESDWHSKSYSETGVVDGEGLSQNRCNILPTLHEGHIVGMHRHPPTGPGWGGFENFSDYADYWRFMHGYYLKEEPEAYLSVNPRGRSKAFGYPMYCVWLGNILYQGHTSSQEENVYMSFLDTLESMKWENGEQLFHFESKDIGSQLHNPSFGRNWNNLSARQFNRNIAITEAMECTKKTTNYHYDSIYGSNDRSSINSTKVNSSKVKKVYLPMKSYRQKLSAAETTWSEHDKSALNIFSTPTLLPKETSESAVIKPEPTPIALTIPTKRPASKPLASKKQPAKKKLAVKKTKSTPSELTIDLPVTQQPSKPLKPIKFSSKTNKKAKRIDILPDTIIFGFDS